MLAEIHAITDHILFNKNIKWKNININNYTSSDTHLLYQQLEDFIYQYLDQLVSNERKPDLAQKCVSNLYSIKNRLDERAWEIPGNLNQAENQAFIHDLNFYLMISGILLKSHSVFKGFIGSDVFPSETSMFPQFKSHLKRVRQTLNALPESKWIKTILLHQSNNKYLNAFYELKKKACKGFNNDDMEILLKNLLYAFSSSPKTQFEENHKERIISDINHKLNSIKFIPQQRDLKYQNLIREIFSAIIFYGKYASGKLISAYLNLISGLLTNNPLFMEAEVHYFTKLLKKFDLSNKDLLNINPMASIHLTDILNQLKELKCNSQPLSVQDNFIIWSHNPKVFVNFIHNAIDEGYISLKGNSDVKPIIEFLCNFVKVQKQNNSGMLTTASLLTYFKKANSGDL